MYNTIFNIFNEYLTNSIKFDTYIKIGTYFNIKTLFYLKYLKIILF